DALLQRRREDERLEGRARRSLPLDGEIELTLAEVVAAVHGDDLAGAWTNRDERGRRTSRRGQHRFDRPPREALQTKVDRGLHVEAAAENAACPVLRDQLLLDVVREVGRGSLDAREPDILGTRKRRAVRAPKVS